MEFIQSFRNMLKIFNYFPWNTSKEKYLVVRKAEKKHPHLVDMSATVRGGGKGRGLRLPPLSSEVYLSPNKGLSSLAKIATTICPANIVTVASCLKNKTFNFITHRPIRPLKCYLFY